MALALILAALMAYAVIGECREIDTELDRLDTELASICGVIYGRRG